MGLAYPFGFATDAVWIGGVCVARKQQETLQTVVGQETYGVWTDMLHDLVPDGRTHRLAPMIAGMLRYASDMAYEKHGANPAKGTIARSLLLASEASHPDEAGESLSDIVEQLFQDAKVRYERTSSRGEGYSIVERAIHEFVEWYSMPWEG